MSNHELSDENCTPPEMREAAREISIDLLPEKSREAYEETYTKFVDWKKANKAITSENCLKVYFKMLMKSYKPTTMWSIHSKLKNTIKVHENVSIETYKELTALLSNYSKGYKSTKAKIFTTEEIKTFLNTAPDETYLAHKVVVIFGLSGCCRKGEIYAVKASHITKQGALFAVEIPDTKNNVPRKFIIDSVYAPTVQKYLDLRPAKVQRENFFLQYHNGKCTNQVIGINTVGSMPRKVAEFLGLKDPQEYKGHSLRRTSATVLADTGATTLDLQRFGGWKSATVAQSYVDDSTAYKVANAAKISKAISGSKKENLESKSENVPSKKPKIDDSQSNDLKESSEKTFVLNNCSVTIHYNK
ncbi:uncharacterized protein LOC127285356 [Leptopilina boulardi]|uniref:uncharacterized protein LOC127285356 n=1 Tax=Leptopilina boulardi TaxID=63433 RepID=UPI0021F56E4B|nr:uncharacterized protein LOC127285356 [Leptopilina boulardi]